MARLILDTTVLIDAERHGETLESVIADHDDVAIAAVTVAELLVGVELADVRRRPARTLYVADVVATISVESYDVGVARAHARLLAHARRSGRPRGAHDLIIAATALERNRTLLSADTDAFADLPALAFVPPEPAHNPSSSADHRIARFRKRFAGGVPTLREVGVNFRRCCQHGITRLLRSGGI